MALPQRKHDPKRDVLKDVFGFDDFRPGQEAAIDSLLAGRNVLTVMPTGSGKSLCYQVPALVMGGLTVVVSPLVALMQDQVAALRLAGVAVESINSSRNRDENVAAWRRVAAGEVRLLYMAPERLMTERMLDALFKLDVRLIAIDEAHCVSQWGPAFRPEYSALSRLADLFPKTPIIALTATADEVTRADIALQLFGNRVETLVLGFDRPNIALTVKSKHNAGRQLLDFIARHRAKSGIVYCLSRAKTGKVAKQLCEAGVTALAYHAGMDKDLREANQNRFMTEPAVVMVATIAFGMGIDKADVRFVFHTDLPGSLEAYYQEIGRAGRDGEAAEAHMLFGLEDIRMRRVFIDQEDAGEDRKRREHARLNMLLAYCEASRCRRQLLLEYFGERAEPCGNCDICRDPAERIDATEDAKKILAAIRGTGERYGAGHIIDVLLGNRTERMTEAHAALDVFGKGTLRKKDEWQALIRQMAGDGLLRHDLQGYGGLEIAEKGHALLRGHGTFEARPIKPRVRTKKESRNAQIAEQSEADQGLIAALKALRMRLAKEKRVPPYVIFSDKSLIDMAQLRPRDDSEFGMVHGVGAAKLKEFGKVFLAAIREHRVSWIALAFCGPVLWALSTHIDKYLVEKFFKTTGVGTLLIFTSLIGLIGLPIIWAFVDVLSIGTTGVIVTSVSGLLYMTAMYFYLRALQQEEATTIAPLFQTSTLFTYAIAYFVLHETLTTQRIAGGLLIMASAAVISYDPDHRRKFKLPIVALVLACTATLAASAVIFKFFAIKDAFWPVTFWTFAGEAVFGAAMLAVPFYRREFMGMFAKHPGAVIGINAANELINLGGGLAARWASLLGPVSLVQAIGGTTSFFVFLFGVLISLFFPKFGREDLSRGSLIQKGIAVVLIVAGVTLIGRAGAN